MPRGGGKKSHKGKHRQFTSPEELEEQRKRDLAMKNQQGAESSSEEESEEDEKQSTEINNPNRAQQKSKKLSELNEVPTAPAGPLSRRQREEIARQEAQRRYEQLHREGKTEEARADLARLAIVRKQREEAAKKREEEKKAKDILQNKQKTQSLNAIKASGKRGKS